MDGFEQLTLSNAGLCDVLKDRILETLQAEDNKFEDLQHDIRGNLYLVPNTVSWPMEMVKGPSTTEVPIHYALKIRRENGQVDDVIIQMEMVSLINKSTEQLEWKLVVEARFENCDVVGGHRHWCGVGRVWVYLL